MADLRPYVVNAKVINLLNNAPIERMVPSLGSLIQRKTVDVGCYPFPFMVNKNNIPLDGRTIVEDGRDVKLEVRPVPYWCSENSFAEYYGDPTNNNGSVVWINGIGRLQPNYPGATLLSQPVFRYDSALGVTYPLVRHNTLYMGMDNTVPVEWVQLKNSVLGTDNGLSEIVFQEGPTFEIGSSVVFKIWSGLTLDVRAIGNGTTYGFALMQRFNEVGGTYSPFLDRYNYGCLQQIFYNENFFTIAQDPNEFWEGAGVSYGVSGGLTGELFLIQSLTGGDNAGSYFVETPGNQIPSPLSIILDGASGSTLSGRQIASNLYAAGGVQPFFSANDPKGGLIETMALLLGTNQRLVTLADGTTASLRALNFNSPCSDAFTYNEGTTLGQWGYEVQKIGVGEDVFAPGEPVEIGCNLNTFIDYMEGVTSKNHGLPHPVSWMFWKGISFDGQFQEYRQGHIHDFVGTDIDPDTDAEVPVYNKLEGIHDYLCYEYFVGDTLKERVYYPIRPITGRWYEQNIAPLYEADLTNRDKAQAFGSTLDKKYDTGFSDQFKGEGSANTIDGVVSLRSLDEDIEGINIEFDSTTSELNGVTGFLFPYFTPLASFAMKGLGNGAGDLQISGEFVDNFGGWNKAAFNLADETNPIRLYQYYADGVTSSADFTVANSAPYLPNLQGDVSAKPNFRLFSWNALSRISPLQLPLPTTPNASPIKVLSSFRNESTSPLGKAEYEDTSSGANTLRLDGTQVDIDPLNFPPLALPKSTQIGLTYSAVAGESQIVVQLDCGSFVNVVRTVNDTPPNQQVNGVFGLTASRTLIGKVEFDSPVQEFDQFDSTDVIDPVDGNPSANFSRTSGSVNSGDNFFTGNFFFNTEQPSVNPRSVFGGSYFLSAADYYGKYVNNSETPQVNWWEGVDNRDVTTTANQIVSLLTSPASEDKWSTSPSPVFRGIPYTENDTLLPGIVAALNQGVHPSFVFRLFTTVAIGNVDSNTENSDPYYVSCGSNWTIGGVPCHKSEELLNYLYTDFANYFGGGLTGCNQFGVPDVADESFFSEQYKDFFFRCKIAIQDFFGNPPQYAYSEPYFSPQSGSYAYQNAACSNAGGDSISDPPLTASLTPFGTDFAKALAVVEGKNADSYDYTDRKLVRDELFKFFGNTASINENGSDNSLGDTTVSAWLDSRLADLFSYYNANRTNQSPNLAKVKGVIQTLYPQRFSAYETSLADAKLYQVWAIKPKCVEQWTPECSEAAKGLFSENTFRFAAFSPPDTVFNDDVLNSDATSDVRANRPTLEQIRAVESGVFNAPPLTTDDIISTNNGFISAFKTVYIEPLGLAEDVLATEEQAVPRATISSTVFGKVTTIIDSRGFLKDVNVITFESGFGTQITGNPEGNTLRFAVVGITLGSLENTSITNETNGDILMFDAELGRWVNAPMPLRQEFFYQETPPTDGVTMGTRWMNDVTGIEYIFVLDGATGQWVQASIEGNAVRPSNETRIVTGSEYRAADFDYFIGVSFDGRPTIYLPTEPEEGVSVIVKDISGRAGYANKHITVMGGIASHTIDNEESAVIGTNNGALQFIYKDGWKII